MGYFPIFTDISGKIVLIFGGTRHALEKVQRLAPFGAKLRVIAPEVLPEIAGTPEAEVLLKPYEPSDLTCDPAFVIAAGPDREENATISAACQRLRIPVNVVDDPPLCTFYFPSLVVRGDLSVGICSAGKCPAATVLIREQAEAGIPENIDAILNWAYNLRPALQRRFPAFSQRRPVTRALVEAAFAQNRPLTPEETEALLAHM